MGYKAKQQEERLKKSNEAWLKKPKLHTGNPNTPWRGTHPKFFHNHKDYGNYLSKKEES